MEKKFTVAGTAMQHGVTKVRFAKNKEAKRGEYKKPISIAEIRSRKKDVTPTQILEQTGFTELNTSELD